MIRKLLCWLGRHEYKKACTIWKTKGACYKLWRLKNSCDECECYKPICKHCGKVKKWK